MAQPINKTLILAGKIIFTSALVLFFVWKIAGIIGSLDEVKAKAKVYSLNRVMPSSYKYLAEIRNKGTVADPDKLRQYIVYYEKMVEVMPTVPAGYGLLGYCYYHAGDYQKAELNYLKAIKLNPDFFWYYYNLGIIYYRTGDYNKAVNAFHFALKSNPKNALVYVSKSNMIYLPVISGQIKTMDKLQEVTVGAYKELYVLLTDTYFKLNQFSQVISLSSEALNNDHPFKDFYCYKIGRAAYELKNYKQAVIFFYKAI